MLCDYCYHDVPTEVVMTPQSRMNGGALLVEGVARNVCRFCERKYLTPIPEDPGVIAAVTPRIRKPVRRLRHEIGG